MTVVDCFSFHNELDLLRLRLRLLAPVVDQFLVIEACQTHSGLSKEPTLRNLLKAGDLGLESAILQKLRVYTVEEFPNGLDHWGRERFQRDVALELINGQHGSPRDLHLLVCDLDELPNPDFIRQYRDKPNANAMIPITMWLCYFKPNFVRIAGTDREWSGPFLTTFGLATANGSLSRLREQARQRERFERKPLGRFQGWHLSYQGDEKFISVKRQAFAHQEDRVQKALISVTDLIRDRRGPFDDPNAPPQWAVLPIEGLGMPDLMTSDPFIRNRVITKPDNLGRLFLSQSPKEAHTWSLKKLFRS